LGRNIPKRELFQLGQHCLPDHAALGAAGPRRFHLSLEFLVCPAQHAQEVIPPGYDFSGIDISDSFLRSNEIKADRLLSRIA
jgi:hypothetical protein